MIKSERCSKCKGKGSFSNPMLKRTEKCKQCNGKGWIDKEYPDPIERTDKCPVDCSSCPEDKYSVCPDKSMLLPKYNELNEHQIKSYADLAWSYTWGMILINMMKYPNNRIRVGKSIEVVWNEGEAYPQKEDPIVVNSSLYFDCVMAIGTAVRTGKAL